MLRQEGSGTVREPSMKATPATGLGSWKCSGLEAGYAQPSANIWWSVGRCAGKGYDGGVAKVVVGMDGRRGLRGMLDGVGDCEPTDWASAPWLAAFLLGGADVFDTLEASACLSFRWSCWLCTHSNVHCLLVLAQFVHGPTRSKSSSEPGKSC